MKTLYHLILNLILTADVIGIRKFREKYGKKLAKDQDSVTIIRKMREERYGKNHLRRLGIY